MSSATPTQFRSLSTAEKLQLIETNEDLGLTAEQKSASNSSVAWKRPAPGFSANHSLDHRPTGMPLDEPLTLPVPDTAAWREIEDFEATIAELQTAGVPFRFGPMPTPVCRMAGITDPDGYSLLIHQRNPGHH